MRLYISTKNYKVLDLPKWARKMLRRAGLGIDETGQHVDMYKKAMLKRMADTIEQGLDNLEIEHDRDFADEYTIYFELPDDEKIKRDVKAFIDEFTGAKARKRDLIKLKLSKKVSSKVAMAILKLGGLEIWLEE